MKEIFFKGLAVALPICVVGGLLYLVLNGFYQLYADIRLKKELEQLRRESEERRRQQAVEQPNQPPKQPKAPWVP